MVDPFFLALTTTFLALTTTPSIGPSLVELTRPVSAAAACACTDGESGPAWMINATKAPAVMSNRFFRLGNLGQLN